MFALRGLLFSMAIPAMSGLSAASDRLMLERRFDFRGGQFDNARLRVMGQGTSKFLQPSPDGLRASIPKGSGPVKIAFKPQYVIEGDFEITVSFEVIHVDKPDKGYGVGPGIYVSTQSEGEDAATLSRLVRVKEGEVFGAHYATSAAPKEEKRKQHVKLSPASEQTGKLRLVRSGELLRYFVVDGKGEEFRQIDSIRATKDDIDQIWITLNRNGASTGAEVLWKDLIIRAYSFREASTGNPAAPVAIGLTVFVAAVGGIWYWRARRSRTLAAIQSAIPSSASADPVSQHVPEAIARRLKGCELSGESKRDGHR